MAVSQENLPRITNPTKRKAAFSIGWPVKKDMLIAVFFGTVCPVVWEDGGSNPASYCFVNRKSWDVFDAEHTEFRGIMRNKNSAKVGVFCVKKSHPKF